MIGTSLSRVKIHEVVQSQIPEAIDSDNPLFGEFLKQYYISQEYQGGTIDIAENLSDYKSLDFLTPDNLTGVTSTASFVFGRDTTIYVDSTKGWPQKWGLLKIDDEIITYTGIGTTSFNGCIRGFSGIENNQKTNAPEHLTFTNTGIATHAVDAQVKNLSNAFLQTFFKKLKNQISPGFEDRSFTGNLNTSNFLRQVKDFYSSKGTDEAFRILFRTLYDEHVVMFRPQEYLFKPSDAEYIVNDVLVCEKISGRPEDIVSQPITQGDASASVYQVEKIILNNNTYYKIRLSTDTIDGTFKVTNRSYTTQPVSLAATTVTVDSTVGFAKSGDFVIGRSKFTYTDKSVTEFLNVVGYTSAPIGSVVDSSVDAISYGDGDLRKTVKLRILNSITGFEGDAISQQKGSEYKIKSIGTEEIGVRYTEWLENISTKHVVNDWKQLSANSFELILTEKHNYIASDEIYVVDEDGVAFDGSITGVLNDTTVFVISPTLTAGKKYFIRQKIKTKYGYVANVQNTYKLDDTVVVAANSLPHWNIDPQKRIRSFNTSGISTRTQDVQIPEHNLHHGDVVVYNPVTSGSPVVGLNTGQSYYVTKLNSSSFYLSLSAENARRGNYIYVFDSADIGSNTEHTLTPYAVGFGTIGSQRLLRKFDNPEFAETKDPVASGSGVGLFVNGVESYSYKSSDKVFYGAVQSVDVLNTGSSYDLVNPPRLSVQQEGHSGVGASIVAHVSGTFEEILVDSAGIDYSITPAVKIEGGNGRASAEAKMKLAPREVSFDSTTVGGILNTSTNKFTFPEAHGFKHGEEIIYGTDGSTTIGIGTTPGNLIDKSNYFVIKNDDYTLSLAKTRNDALVGVTTLPITTNGGGLHRFETKLSRLTVDKIEIISATTFSNRENTMDSVGINTWTSVITAPNHHYSSGDIIRYGGSDQTGVTGLTSGNDYYVIKITDNTFRVSISTSLVDYVRITNEGSGTHSFNYPPITVTIDGAQGISTANASATPIVRGKIDNVHVKSKGSRFGSVIINDNYKPDVVVVEGSKAAFDPIILNGRIDSVIVKSGGKDFFSIPNIIVNGDGVGAKLKARISNGKVIAVDVITAGGGYTENGTTVIADSPGEGAILSANLNQWTINDVERYAKFGDVKDDDGFYGEFKDSDNGYPYVNYYASRKLREYVGDDGTKHSPILGWAYDGHPIYGPYATDDPSGIGALKYLEPSYAKITGSRTNGPDLSEFEAGFFIEDFQFIDGFGDLDQHNGRFAATPEYPNGVYAYYITESSSVITSPLSPFYNRREPLFPYIVGDTYHSKVNSYNNEYASTQDTLPSGLVRNTNKYNITDYEFIAQDSKVKTSVAQIKNTKKGSIDNVKILEGGSEYNIGDKLTFDNSNTNGFGAFGKVSELVGAAATVLTSSIRTNERIELFAKGKTVTGIVTTGLHDYPDGIPVQISGISSTIYSGLEGSFNITVDFVRSGLGTSLLATGLTTSIPLRDRIDIFEVQDIVQVGDEQMRVIAHDHLNQKITLHRAINGTTGAAHTDRAEIYRRENKFNYELDNPLDVATPINERVYFDAQTNIGVGLTGGVGIGTTVSNIGAGNTLVSTYIPIKSIRIPSHPFVHGDPITYTPSGGSNLLYSFNGSNTQFLPTSGLFVQKISNDLIGIVTQASQIDNQYDRIYFNGTIGVGNSHSFRTDRAVPRANATIFEVTVSTATTHHLDRYDEVEFDVVSAGSSILNMEYNSGTRYISIGSSNNPPIYSTIGEKLIFDTADPDLTNTRLDFFLDQEYSKKFVGTGISAMERVDNLVPGITSARTTLHLTRNVPDVLYYKFTSTSPAKTVYVDEDVTDYGKIIIQESEFSGKHSLTTSTGRTFKFFTGGLPERVGYTSESYINYTTSSKTARGAVSKVALTEGGVRYDELPKVSIASTTGQSAVLLAETESAGQLLTTDILEFGYDHSSDPTLVPYAAVPNIISLRDNFSIENVAITSTGSKYLSAPDVVVYNSINDSLNSSVELVAKLEGTSVNSVRIINSGGNLKSTDNQVLAINNSNGVGIISATYSDPTVTLRLKTPSGGFTTALPLPFTIGDEIFVENVGVSSGNGYNSSDYGYNFFTVTGVNTNPGLVDQATLTYKIDQNPGFHDRLGFGIVTRKNDIAQFKLELKEGTFFAGEEIYTDDASTHISEGRDSSTNIIRVDSLVGFNTGDLVRGRQSRASGVVEDMNSNTGKFTVGPMLKRSFGWEKDTGKTSEYFQRIQDNDYYQNFAYSLKSLVGISSWGEPVDSLAHPAGFKKHSDLLVPSVGAVGLGASSHVRALDQSISSLVLIDNSSKVYCKHDFDLVRELTDATQTKSDKVVFQSNKFGNALICKTNRVLEIDDISPQFYSDPDINRGIDLDIWNIDKVSAVKYYAQIVLDISSGIAYNETQYSEFVVSHNGTVAMVNQYSDLADSFDLGDFNADLSVGGQVTVSFTPYNSTFIYDITFYKEVLDQGIGIGTTSYGGVKKVGVSSYVAPSGSPSAQIIQSIDAEQFKSGTVFVAVDSPNEKEVLEASFVGVGSTAQYIEFGKMKEDMDLGTFDIGMTGTNDLQLKFTPVAGIGVTISTLATLVGVATTAVGTGIPAGSYEVGDAYLQSSRTEIAASGTPSATNISNLTYNNYTSIKYYVEIQNVTNNEYSAFHVAANAYGGDSNSVKWGNVSTGLTATRDIDNTDINISAPNVLLQFTPMENRTYIVRVSEIRIDKPDDVANDTTIKF